MRTPKRLTTWLLAISVVAVALAVPARAFVRDTYGHWAAPIVARFAALGTVARDEPFRPDEPVTRGELVNLLVLAAGLRAPAAELAGVRSSFVDLAPDHPLAGPAELAYEHGWIIGDGSGLQPDRHLTRAELAVILTRIYDLLELDEAEADAGPAAGTDPAVGAAGSATGAATAFRDDADIPDWARAAVAAATAQGLINGFPDGTFRPHDTATRAQAATLLQALIFRRGDGFTVVGRVDGYDVPTRTLTIDGAPWAFAQDALIMRDGRFTSPLQLPPTDLFRAIANSDGEIVYAESVPLEDLAVVVHVQGDTLTAAPLSFRDWQHWRSTQSPPAAGRFTLQVSRHALIFRNGERASLSDLRPSDRVYLRRDARDDTVIALDATHIHVNGYIEQLEPAAPDGTVHLTLLAGPSNRQTDANLTADSIVYIDGARTTADDLQPGDRVVVTLAPAVGGEPPAVLYVEATR